MQDTRQRILSHLGCQPEATVSDLADAVGLAPVTVRHHLNVLRERGLVSLRSEPIGRGRPRHVYSLSSTGAGSLCSGGYEALATRMIDLIKEGEGPSAERFFEAMAQRIADEEGAFRPENSVESRLDALVGLLSKQGFLAHWERDGNEILVRELGCPYASLGSAHAEICCMDRALIEATGCGEVTRERWRMDGDDCCVYRIRCDQQDVSLQAPPLSTPANRAEAEPIGAERAS